MNIRLKYLLLTMLAMISLTSVGQNRIDTMDYDYDFVSDGMCFNIIDSEHVYLNGVWKHATPPEHLIVPATVIFKGKTYTVTKIAEYAFTTPQYWPYMLNPRDNDVTTTITIPETVTSITGLGFLGYSALQEINFPNSLVEMHFKNDMYSNNFSSGFDVRAPLKEITLPQDSKRFRKRLLKIYTIWKL